MNDIEDIAVSSCAEEYQPDALARKVLNLDVTFHWIGDSDRFWFKRETRAGSDFVVVDAESGDRSIVSRMDTACTGAGKAHEEVVSPDGGLSVVRRREDLWLRNLSSDEERRMTHNGEPNFGYGDVDPSYDRQSVARRRADQKPPLLGVIWSPDSRYVVALRQDLRPYPEELFVAEYVPPDGAYTHPHFRRIVCGGNVAAPESTLIVFDTRTSTTKKIALDPQALNDLALPSFIEGIVWWTRAADRLFLLIANRGGSRFGLLSVELDSGNSREILHETARFNVRLNPFDYARPNVHVLADGTEVVWYSERSGYGHLYLYDAGTGELKRQLTHGEWVVFDLLRVDEAERIIYFTAATRSEGENPYYRYLYRTSLDGGEPELLTPEIADHKFSNLFFRGAYRFMNDGTARPQPGSSISPSGRYFVDSYSTTDQPPEYVLRRASGELITKLLSADATELYASGWRPPEPVVTKAADGATNLYGVITRPRHFDPSRKYPVIDAMYPGPQGSAAPRTFMDQLTGGPIHHMQTFADAGFIVVAIDGRGTAYRARAFRDAFLGTEDVFGAADHVAALRNLAADRPYMDPSRVGVRGQSFGGYGSLRAMLLFPEFFKVAVAATGPSGYLDAEGQTNVERFFGVPSRSEEARVHYGVISNKRLVDRLSGRVLLIYGGLDESVPLKHAFDMFDAFIKADKDVDMLIVPNASHGVPMEPYVIRRSVRYFIDHLGDSKAKGC